MDKKEKGFYIKYLSFILNSAFYMILFLIVRDVAFAFSQVTMTILTHEGFLGVFLYFYNKISFEKPIHYIYLFTLLIGVFNVLAYKFKTIANNKLKWLKLQFNIQWLSSPACTSILYFLVFAVGIYFSIISSAINEWTTKDTLMSNGTSLSFSIVVAGFSIAIIVFMLNQIAISKKKHNEDRASQKVYQDKLEKLEEIIRFAPPNGFAKVLSDYVDVADDFVQVISANSKKVKKETLYAQNILGVSDENVHKGINSIFSQLDKDKVTAQKDDIVKAIQNLQNAQEFNAKYIRTILIAYARLAALFDDITPSDDNIYRANLMLKYNITDKSIKKTDSFRYIPAVLRGEASPNIKHYLTLHQEHSIKVFSEKTRITKRDAKDVFVPIKFDPDPDITTFSLPFFLGKENKNYNCFGAPKAVTEVECQFINNTNEEIKQWRQEQKSPFEIIEEAQENFNRRNIAKSIVSLPIMLSRYDSVHKSSKNVMGVVNIYRDKTDLMMGNTKKQEQFSHITTPLNFALSKILAHDILHRYHANLLQDILIFAKVG